MYWKVIESRLQLPTGTTLTNSQEELKARNLKDLKANNYLFQEINHSILETILCKKNFQRLMGFNEQEVSRLYQSEACTTLSFDKGF